MRVIINVKMTLGIELSVRPRNLPDMSDDLTNVAVPAVNQWKILAMKYLAVCSQ